MKKEIKINNQWNSGDGAKNAFVTSAIGKKRNVLNNWDNLEKLSEAKQQEILAKMQASGETNPILEEENKRRPLLVQQDKLRRKVASATAEGFGSGGASYPASGATNTIHLAPDLYSPLFLTQNLQLPRDRIVQNAWNRAFYELHPIVRSCINLHAAYPIAKMNITCKEKKIEEFYNTMAEEIDLLSVVQGISLEYWKIGEAFPFAEFDSANKKWKKITVYNPDYIVVQPTIYSGEYNYFLVPDEGLRQIVFSNNPAHIAQKRSLKQDVVERVLKNEYIPLNPFNISHIKNATSPYSPRGTSIIASIWKDLINYDRLRECKLIQADGMINPITLVKLGNSANEGYFPRQEELEQWRLILEQAQYDKDFKIITHPDVSIDFLGRSGALVDISGDYDKIIDNIFFGLMTPKSILTQEGASYASASVGLEVLRQRYDNFRNMLSRWIIHKVFAPIAQENSFWERKDGEKKLILPTIEWNQLTLFDIDSYIQHLTTLRDKKVDNTVPGLSTETMFRSLGLNFEEERKKTKRELIQDIILQKEVEQLSQMNLSDLRSLDPEMPITEVNKVEAPLPGQAPMGGSPSPIGGIPTDIGLPPLGSDAGGGMGGPPPGDLGGGGGMGGPPPPPM